MLIDANDQLPLWWLTKSTNLPFRELFPVLGRLGLPLWADPATGHWYSSREAFGRLIARLPETAGS